VVRNRTDAEAIFFKYGIHGEVFEADLRYSEMIQRLFQKIRPSITFNMAGYGVDHTEHDEKTAYQINADLVKTISETVAKIRDPNWAGQDIVHVGSALEYGNIGGNLSEDSIPNPTTLYGKSKLAGTNALTSGCKTYGVKGLTARLFMVYGPGEYLRRLMPSLMKTANTRKPLLLTDGKQKKDFTFVEDVVEGFIRLGLVKAEPGEIVNMATGRLISVRRFAEAAARILRIPSSLLEFGAIPTRTEEIEHQEIRLDHLRQLLGWVPPTGIEEGILKTVNFENCHEVQGKQHG
jgi:nucleoside-diphosphate-sugar epimerase